MPVIDHKQINHILISRIDAIGDVVLQLPACVYLKQLYPDVTISFLGRSYTRAVVDACQAVDHFINYDELKSLSVNEVAALFKSKNIDAIVHEFPKSQVAWAAQKAGIKIRIGASNKLHHYLNCNRVVKLNRAESNLHEAQQNIYMCTPLGVTHIPTIGTIANYYPNNFKPSAQLPARFKELLQQGKFNLVLHTKSNGNGREWAQENFTELIKQLPADKFRLFITGSEKEHEMFKTWITQLPPHVIDVSGQMQLNDLIAFIYHADGLVASGTGPLHLAAASGIYTLGLFPTSASINATRWAPLGVKATHIESTDDDLSSISVAMVKERIYNWLQ
jgi:heptosyltransferase-3